MADTNKDPQPTPTQEELNAIATCHSEKPVTAKVVEADDAEPAVTKKASYSNRQAKAD